MQCYCVALHAIHRPARPAKGIRLKDVPSLTPAIDAALTSELRRLKDEAPWHELARHLSAYAGGDLYGLPGTRAALAAACGLSPGIVGRYISTIERILRIAREKNVEPAAVLSGGFNAVEAACRLYERSPDQGFESLLQLKAGTSSLSKVRGRLAAAEPERDDSGSYARSLVLRQRSFEIEAVEEALSGAAQNLFGRGCTVRRRPGLRYFRRVGMEVVAGDGSIAAGLDVIAPQLGQQRDELDAALGASALLSTFFPEFHFICSPGSGGEVAARAVEMLGWLGLQWFGVMTIDANGRVRVLRKARGRPVPDRSAQYGALKERYAVGRRNA
jgi:hypothetical protein